MKFANAPLDRWLKSGPFRLLVLLFGIATGFVFVAVMFVVALNLPYSWPGLLAVIIGFSGAAACYQYFKNPRLVLLIPIAAVLLMVTVYLSLVLIYGDTIDAELQMQKNQSSDTR